jgi:hypothetical protein
MYHGGNGPLRPAAHVRGDISWPIAAKRGVMVAMADGAHKRLAVLVERRKAQMRARVEHPEPPRLSRRLVGLSHADMADSGTCE